jgi:hypothetical protein
VLFLKQLRITRHSSSLEKKCGLEARVHWPASKSRPFCDVAGKVYLKNSRENPEPLGVGRQTLKRKGGI